MKVREIGICTNVLQLTNVQKYLKEVGNSNHEEEVWGVFLIGHAFHSAHD